MTGKTNSIPKDNQWLHPPPVWPVSLYAKLKLGFKKPLDSLPSIKPLEVFIEIYKSMV
jgi:hypothetical protein